MSGKRRTALTLDKATDAALAKLSLLQKRPKATIAAELLNEMAPTLSRIGDLLEIATKNRSRLPADTAANLASLEALLRHTGDFAVERMGVDLQRTEAPKRSPSAPARRRIRGRSTPH